MGYYDRNGVNFSDLVGKVVVEITGLKEGSEEVIFICSDGSKYSMYHYQDCCESVDIEDIDGDVSDIIGSVILVADETSNSSDPALSDYADSYTWTYYKIDTNKGGVTIRWYGSSNGYYSESVSFCKFAGDNT